MGKQTRAGFLVALGALTTGALLGCAGGAPPDSKYQGAYRSVYTIPSTGESGIFNFSVEKKGGMTGAFVDANTNKTLAFNGSVGNDGRFRGDILDSGVKYGIEGTLASAGGDFEQVRGASRLRGSFSVGGTLNNTTSEFQGNYNGVWNVPGVNQGTISFSVDRNGNITGLLTRTNASGKTETGLFAGSVKNSGAFAATAGFGVDQQALNGTLVKTQDNTTLGNFVLVISGVQNPGTFGPTTVRTGDSPFKGSYRGTYGLPENDESGNISFTVDPAGTITGFFSQNKLRPVGLFNAAIANDGSFSGTVSYPAGSPAPYDKARPIVGKLGATQVNNATGLSGDFVLTINGISVPGNCEVSVGGSELDSDYKGSYAEGDIVPGYVFPNGSGGALAVSAGSASITVDLQGEFTGSIGNLRATGRITNDGRMVGSIGAFPITGKVAKQLLPATYNKDREVIYKQGAAADLTMTVDGQDYQLVLTIIGGN